MQDPVLYWQRMTEQLPPRQKRVAPETGSGINGLIAACNSNDRFKLLEDESVLEGNLNNSIHPLFGWFESKGPMKQMLQLASQFISHDSLLVFFVPLLYGRELIGTIGCTSKTYLSDPIANVSEEKRIRYLAGVREALHCLGHSVAYCFHAPAKRVYARTIRSEEKPAHVSTCCAAFQRRYSCKIEIAEYFHNYYRSGEYAAASRCAQFRHDFLLAATLIHEIVHAIGVLRRGNLNEPHIRADFPETEWGYGWEHFMFGNVIDPQDRTRSGTHLLMRKVWADQKLAEKAGGKEYCDVPMSYIAQWFRRETWDIIAERGPTAILPPTTHFKIQSSNREGAWVVSSDCADIKQDLKKLHQQWKLDVHSSASEPAPLPRGRTESSKIFWKLMTTEKLQKNNVPTPMRVSQRPRYCLAHGKRSIRQLGPKKITPEQVSDDVCRWTSPSYHCTSEKRPADVLNECGRANKTRNR